MLFQVFAIAQAIGFVATSVYTPELELANVVVAATLATVILTIGTQFSPRISPVVFHRLVMAVLGFSALRLLHDAIA